LLNFLQATPRAHSSYRYGQFAKHLQVEDLHHAITAGIDLALALVEADLGRSMALAVARRLVMFLRRPGGRMKHHHGTSLQRANPDSRAAQADQHFISAKTSGIKAPAAGVV
jgi:hypothetical protein